MLALSKKSAQFRHLLPLIEEKLAYGYKYAEVTAILKVEHNLDMSVNLFATYLHRYRPKAEETKKRTREQVEKIIINPSFPTSPSPPVAQTTKPQEYETEKDNLKKAREMLAQERKKLNLSDLLGA